MRTLKTRLETLEAMPVVEKTLYNFDGIPIDDQRDLRDFLGAVKNGTASMNDITPKRLAIMKKSGWKEGN